jgi:FkbM family methyltransferase
MPIVAFILAATDSGPMIVNRLDVCRTEQGYFGVGASLLETGQYDRSDIDGLSGVLSLRRQHHGDGVVALDVGANIGTHTICWAKLMRGPGGHWGRVVAVEAQERVFYALAGNLALNNLFNAEAIHAVVGEGKGLMNIPVLDHAKPASFGSLELRKVTEEDIGQIPASEQIERMTTIDAIIGGERCDLIKLDVEGMEPDALRGADSTLDRCRPVLFIEWVKCGEAPIRALLEPRGYGIHMLGMNLLAIHRDDPIAAHVTPRNKKAPDAGAPGA